MFKATLRVKVAGSYETPAEVEGFLTELLNGSDVVVDKVTARVARVHGGVAEKIAKLEVEIKELNSFLTTVKIASIKSAFGKLLDSKNSKLKRLQDKRDGVARTKKVRTPKAPKASRTPKE